MTSSPTQNPAASPAPAPTPFAKAPAPAKVAGSQGPAPVPAKVAGSSAPKPVPAKPANPLVAKTPTQAPTQNPAPAKSGEAKGAAPITNPPAQAPKPAAPASAPAAPAPVTSSGNQNVKVQQDVFGHVDKETKAKSAAFVKDVKQFATDEGKGIQSRAKFARRVCQAAQDKLIDEKDAKVVFTQYGQALAAANNRVYEPPSSLPVQASKLNAFIKLAKAVPAGTATHPETGEAENVTDMLLRAETVRANLAANPDLAKKIKDKTFDFLVNVCRKQLTLLDQKRSGDNANALMTDAEITSVALGDDKEEAAPKTEGEQLLTLIKSAKRLHDGATGTENTPAKPGHPSQELNQAIALLITRLAKVDGEAAKQFAPSK